jgi:hypothetical protein
MDHEATKNTKGIVPRLFALPPASPVAEIQYSTCSVAESSDGPHAKRETNRPTNPMTPGRRPMPAGEARRLVGAA